MLKPVPLQIRFGNLKQAFWSSVKETAAWPHITEGRWRQTWNIDKSEAADTKSCEKLEEEEGLVCIPALHKGYLI